MGLGELNVNQHYQSCSVRHHLQVKEADDFSECEHGDLFAHFF